MLPLPQSIPMSAHNFNWVHLLFISDTVLIPHKRRRMYALLRTYFYGFTIITICKCRSRFRSLRPKPIPNLNIFCRLWFLLIFGLLLADWPIVLFNLCPTQHVMVNELVNTSRGYVYLLSNRTMNMHNVTPKATLEWSGQVNIKEGPGLAWSVQQGLQWKKEKEVERP